MASFLRRAWWSPENVSPQYEDKIKEFPTTSLEFPPTLPIIYQPRHIPSSQISTEKNKIRDRQGHTYSHSQPKDEIPNYHFVIFFHSWNPPPHSKRYHGRPDHRRRNHGHHHIIILSMRKPHPQSVMIVIRWELSRQWNWSFKMSTASLLCYTGFSSRAGYNTTQQHTGPE